MQAGGQNNYTNYISGGVYKNGALSFISTGQGRTNMEPATPRQEYFVKDHLGNIRSTVASAVTGGVTPGPQSLAYTAGYEPADEATETALFDKVSELRADKPGSLGTADQKAALLQENQRLGTSIMLKVMAGDKVDINAESFYESLQQNNSNTEAPAGQLFEQVIGSLAGGSGALSSAEGSSPSVLTERILSNPEAITAYEDLLEAETDSTRPKAFLNYLFFDEEMNLVPEHSRIWQADGENSWSRIGSAEYAPLEVPQNGYIVSYLSHQSGQEAWFDNMSLVVSPGILLEERHYYAYGLPIAGLGSQAATALSNRQRYQGNEYIEERGLDWMDFHNRQYDPQLGRFLSVDPLADAGGQQVLSPYHAMGCNPVSMMDPLGLKAGLAPGTNIPNYGAPNAGIEYIEGQMVVLGGTKAFNFEGDWESHKAWHAEWVKEGAGEYEKASETKSGDKPNDGDSPDHWGPDKNTKDKKSEVKTKVRRDKYKTKTTKGSQGVSTTETSYELDHENSILEIETQVKSLNGVTDNVDIVVEWMGGVTTLKGLIGTKFEIPKNPSLLKRSTMVFGLVGTHLGLINEKIKQQTKMYEQVLTNYYNLHSTSPQNMSGIKVNTTLYAAPYGNTFVNYSFHDLHSGAYLGGGSFK